MRPILLLFVLIFAVHSAQAGDESTGGVPCNTLCQWWLGLKQPQSGIPVPSEPDAQMDRTPTGSLDATQPPFDEGVTSEAAKTLPRRVQPAPRWRAAHRLPRMHDELRLATRDVPLPMTREAVLRDREVARTTPASRPVTHLMGGYPGAVPPDPRSGSTPGTVAAATPEGPAWEQAALRVFQGLNDPLPTPPDEPVPRRRSRKR